MQEKLSFLVSHIEGEIYNAKLDKSLELRNKAETDQLEQLTATLKSRERELEKVCEKTNSSSYELSKKEDAIRALRSERTIVSELLDKIERELCNLEHCYKVLVIESTIEEHQC
jgi:vacuolar-type H+-ATPase subunit I/STV1